MEKLVHVLPSSINFHVGDYNIALNQLSEAEKHNSSRGMAKQWLKFVQTKKSSNERLQAQVTTSSVLSTYFP